MDKNFQPTSPDDILSKYESLDKYSLVFILTKMIRKGIAKSQHDAMKQLEEGVDITNLFTQESEEISTDDEENKEAQKI